MNGSSNIGNSTPTRLLPPPIQRFRQNLREIRRVAGETQSQLLEARAALGDQIGRLGSVVACQAARLEQIERRLGGEAVAEPGRPHPHRHSSRLHGARASITRLQSRRWRPPECLKRGSDGHPSRRIRSGRSATGSEENYLLIARRSPCMSATTSASAWPECFGGMRCSSRIADDCGRSRSGDRWHSPPAGPRRRPAGPL